MISKIINIIGCFVWMVKSIFRSKIVSFDMVCDPNDTFDAKFKSRTFAPELVLALKQVLCKGDWVIDAGAQKGYVTLHAATLVGETGRVLAFEPDPRSREILIENCRLNSFSNVDIFSSALGDCSDTRSINLSSQLGWTSFYPNERNHHTIIGQHKITVSKMDDIFLPLSDKIDNSRLIMVKIDCEGAEPEVLRGMGKLLSSFSPYIWIEINTGSLKAAGSSEHSLLNLLWKQQYATYKPKVGVNKFGIESLLVFPYKGNSDDDSHRVFDILAVRKSQVTKLKLCGVLFE